MSEGIARLLVDSSGNVVKVSQDGDDFKVEVLGKLRDSAGTLINPAKEDGNLASVKTNTDKLDTNLSTRATEATQALIKAKTDNLDVALSTRATEATVDSVKTNTDKLDVNLSSRATEATQALIKAKTDNLDVALSTRATESTQTSVKTNTDKLDVNLSTRATEASLDLVRAKTDNLDVALSTRATEATVASADTVLKAIRDTAGVKKITDQLPAGTNEIGKVAQGTKAAAADGWPQVLYDASGNAVGVVQDDTLYRLQTDSKVAKGTSTLVSLDAIDTTTGQGRLKTTLYTPDGDAVSFGSVPPSPESIKNAFVLNGASSDLLVDGDPTPVNFDYVADPTHDISLQEIAFVIVANSVTFGSDYFGATSGPLTNGLKVEITAGGNTGTVALLKQNEDFVHFASPGGFNWVVSSKDMLSSVFVIGGGLKLKAGTADRVRITVQDDIDSAGTYFKCFVKGSLLE